MFLSYLVTSHNETDSLEKLLSKLSENKKHNHEIVLVDDYSDNPETIKIIDKYKSQISFYQHKLERNYGAHKNYGIEQCKGEWIFQLDADEYPTDALLQNINEVIESNNINEVIWLPRLNYFKGVTEQDISMWGWNYNDGMINFPDYQSRLYRNRPHIRYERRLHEKVEGFKSYSFVPPQKDYAIVHEKTIEKQRQTNLNYNKMFTQEENKGYAVK
ncbi:glycosyltransferase [archaeon]|jgi:glycosyltransferase involved in cell wall biosynthesis|nr:glycosyltransferase [archaeon]